jgi:DNA helicase-4
MQKPFENEGGNSLSPQTWALRLCFARWRTALIDRTGLHITLRREIRHGAFSNLSARAQRGWFWSSVIIEGMDAPVLRGLSHEDADRFIKVLAHEKSIAETVLRLDAALKADHDALGSPDNEVEEEMRSSERYLAARDRERLIARVQQMRGRMDETHGRTQSPHAAELKVTQKVIDLLGRFTELPALLDKRNKDFVNRELEQWRPFFDNCEERPLTDEQARAAIIFEENTLLVAAAGSG